LPATDKIKSRRMGPKKSVAHSQDIRKVYEILVGNLKERILLRDFYKEQQQWMFKKIGCDRSPGFIWHRILANRARKLRVI
jgi:hypothetical protein